MIAPTFLLLTGGGDEVINRPDNRSGTCLLTVEAEAADIGADGGNRGVASAGGDEIDGSAQRIAAELKRICTLVDINVPIGAGIDLLKIAIAVGGVDRDSVHIQLDAADRKS